MSDRIVATLPSRDLAATGAFYGSLGFAPLFQSDGWLVLSSGALELEFFPDPDLDPARSAHRCTVRVGGLDDLWARFRASGVPEAITGFPRLHAPRVEESGLRIGYLIDPDGNLLALVEDPS